MWQVGERLHQDLAGYSALVGAGVELVQLQEGKVSLQVVGVLTGLQLHIALQCGDVLGVVSGEVG